MEIQLSIYPTILKKLCVRNFWKGFHQRLKIIYLSNNIYPTKRIKTAIKMFTISVGFGPNLIFFVICTPLSIMFTDSTDKAPISSYKRSEGKFKSSKPLISIEKKGNSSNQCNIMFYLNNSLGKRNISEEKKKEKHKMTEPTWNSSVSRLLDPISQYISSSTNSV